jgi:hypothetical protein
MPSSYIEKCARAAYEATYDHGQHACEFVPWDSLDESRRDFYAKAARAVLEAGRLSECPESIEASANVVWHEHMKLEVVLDQMRLALRAAEDAVLRHPCCPTPIGGPHKFSCPAEGVAGIKLPAVREADGTIRVTLPKKT